METVLGSVDQEELDQLLQLFSFDQLLQAKETLEGMLPDTESIIAEFYRQFAGEDEESVYAALSSVVGIVNTLYETTIPALDKKMEETGNNMDTFNNDHVAILYNSLETTRGKAEELKTEIGNMATEMSNKQSLVSSFAGTVQEVANAANNAVSAVNSLAGALSSINGASISLDTSGIISLPSMPAAVPQFASGGVVGGIFIGGDSVAAMLTPGEFVVRRRAAQALGRSFLENINKLDIPGAMDALMKQALPLPGHFVAYNNSRSYDNHATVNQNIYTNNAAFTYRRASRFVGAL